MATKTKLLVALGALAAAAFAFGKKKKNGSSSGTSGGSTTVVILPVINRPLCGKFPTGNWSPLHGYLEKGEPPDNPGWTEDDVAAVKSAVTRRVPDEIPTFANMKEARKMSFAITRQIVVDLCPQMDVPDKQVTVENYMKQSPGFTFLWQSVENLVWNRLTGGAGSGN